ncbi:hypothetical protein PFICI_10364 [Pestalotiopsis fici W106-1]|uniref:Uncharacterized protein n=1 Tax=Pestalotiopsis fici (strain W106-1 / CGMCC3.15140) TaxID=1229662 RepID=W3WYX2_PESFW|nr:uncharacterized protein PFICI_10364 [Pestalotiopsis fici W106-1]ETS78302.1 hypothetical protein PFICI_10364 [Pestalotiopsis fici W106-1]
MASRGATGTTSTAAGGTTVAPSTSTTSTTTSTTSTTDATKTKATTKKTKKTEREKPVPLPPAVLWAQKNLWKPTENFVRTEASHQEYLVKSVYNRQPRYVGHFLFRLIHSASWIPRYIFELVCLLLSVTTTFIVQLIDLVFTVGFRGLFAFPWASTLFFGLVVGLPTIPYEFWLQDDVQNAVLSGVLVAAWFLWMSHLYMNRPERWLGYTRLEFFPWLSGEELLNGPYVMLAIAVAVFVHFRKDLLTLDTRTIHVEKQPIHFQEPPPVEEEELEEWPIVWDYFATTLTLW